MSMQADIPTDFAAFVADAQYTDIPADAIGGATKRLFNALARIFSEPVEKYP